MTERQIVNWLLGFVIGILTVLAWQRVMSEPPLQSHSDSNPSRGTNQHLQAWCKRCTEHEPRIV
jgi:hypothetical protein